MVLLLLEEGRNGELHGPMLEYFMTENILEEVFSWSCHTNEFVNKMKAEQLLMFEKLISELQHSILVYKPILRPLLKLLQVIHHIDHIFVPASCSFYQQCIKLLYWFVCRCNVKIAKFMCLCWFLIKLIANAIFNTAGL